MFNKGHCCCNGKHECNSNCDVNVTQREKSCSGDVDVNNFLSWIIIKKINCISIVLSFYNSKSVMGMEIALRKQWESFFWESQYMMSQALMCTMWNVLSEKVYYFR